MSRDAGYNGRLDAVPVASIGWLYPRDPTIMSRNRAHKMKRFHPGLESLEGRNSSPSSASRGLTPTT